MPMLLELGANQNASLEGGVTALHWAASGCQLNACDYLRRVNADFEAQDNMGWNAITWASINKDGTIKTVRRLKELGANHVAYSIWSYISHQFFYRARC